MAFRSVPFSDLETGYPLLLAVISLVGAVQILLSVLGAAKLSAAFPVSVVEGMLASIGIMIIHHITQLFRDSVVGREQVGDTYHIRFDRPLVCFNSIHLDRELSRVPASATEVLLHIGDNVAMIDHTSCDTLLHFADEFERHGKGRRVEIVGFEQMQKTSQAEAGMRLAPIRSMISKADLNLSDELPINSPAATEDEVPVNSPAAG